MSVIHDRLLETSIYSSSQNHADPSQRSSKRFRPSVRCHHTNKQTHEQCTAEGFMECVHCDQICCLVHITEHQDELKQLRDDLIQEASEVYLTLTEMQVADNRAQLQSNLTQWKQQMFNQIERIHAKLLDDIEQSTVAVSADFELKKGSLATEFDDQISSKLERLSAKCDFYPHELDELRVSLNDMHTRIRDARTSIVSIDFGSETGSSFDDDSLKYDRNFNTPKILIQTKPDIERILNGSSVRQFHMEFESHWNPTSFFYDTSTRYLLIYNGESQTLELFNHDERIGGGFWPKESSILSCIKWCPYLSVFLVLCTQSLHALDCSQQPFHIYSISHVTPIDGNPMKYISVNNEFMIIKHGQGSAIDYYSMKTMQSIKRWSKRDFYPCDDDSMAIHRLELYSNSYLAMNVELNDENDVIDLFFLPDLQHIRRLESAYLVVYLPLNNYWIIKQKPDDQQASLCLLAENGEIHRLNSIDPEHIIGIRLFGKHSLLVVRQNENSIQMQLYPLEKP